MAGDDKPRDQIGYESLQQEALRAVVRGALERAATPRGLPGDHHFYVSFRTDYPGVVIPEELTARYPEEMTIVLQNQFWDLSPGETSFSVTLQFSGQPRNLAVPYLAMTRFYDPSVQYLLQFTPPTHPGPKVEKVVEPPTDEGRKVVSLDQFRKK